jgi:hypothetical protein
VWLTNCCTRMLLCIAGTSNASEHQDTNSAPT